MRRSTMIALVSLAATTATALAQTREQNWAWCQDTRVADLAIGGCTAIIQSGRETTENLSIAFYNRAIAHGVKGDHDRAIADYDQAVRLDANNAKAYYGRANAYYNKRDYQRSISDFDQAIRLSPNVARYYSDRADAYDNLGQFDRALADYDRGIRLDPADGSIYYNRGIAYAGAGQYERALVDYDQAIKLNPQDAAANKYRGQSNFYLARYGAAAADLGRAFELGRDDAYVALWQHLALIRDRRPGESKLRDHAAKLDANKWPAPVIRMYLGTTTADQLLAAARNADPKTARDQLCEAYFYLGQAALNRGDRGEAARLFQLTVDTGPTTFIEYKAAKAELARLGR